jgi:hypothetical protein
VFGVLDDVGGGEFDIEHAAVKQAGGVGVAIKDARAAEFVLDGDSVTVVPMEEVELDVFAVFVFADFAFAGVAVERRWVAGGFDLKLCCGHLFSRVTEGQAKRTCTEGWPWDSSRTSCTFWAGRAEGLESALRCSAA